MFLQENIDDIATLVALSHLDAHFICKKPSSQTVKIHLNLFKKKNETWNINLSWKPGRFGHQTSKKPQEIIEDKTRVAWSL
jgi:hypothetical protein